MKKKKKFQPNRCTDLDAVLAKPLLSTLARTLLELVTLVKVTVTQYPFYLHSSLLTSLLYKCISQFSYVWSNRDLVCRLDMAFADLYFNFIKIKWVMTSWWRHLMFLYTNVHISNSTEPTNFILGTNIQQHKMHLMIKVQVILTKGDGHRRRSKVT